MVAEAELALTALGYLEAARLFGEAASLVADGEPSEKGVLLGRQANALRRQGEERGDNAALRQAIKVYGHAVGLQPRVRAPLLWATAQNNLGTALWMLAERESGTARLEEAVAAYRAALEEFTASACRSGGRRRRATLASRSRHSGSESGTAWLEEAVAAYRAALEEWTRERAPLEWATAQNNTRPSRSRHSGSGRAGRRGWKRRWRPTARHWRNGPRERAPLDWARAQNNLGIALKTLGGAGERDGASRRGGVSLPCSAGGMELGERAPLDWARAQSNLGSALARLGERESGTARLEAAVTAFRAALVEFTRERGAAPVGDDTE